MNLCTDQLAMMIAAPDQLISVSHLASDPASSVMSARANSIGTNHGLAEELIRLDPDLIVAGTFTTRATVNLLRRLGRNVIEFAPAYSFEDTRANIAKMGDILGREKRAADLLKEFELSLSKPERKEPQKGRVIGSYGANSFTTGANTLESEIVTTAGFEHLGTKLGLKGTSKLPLEDLILSNPDLVMSWGRWLGGPAKSREILRHPALDAWFGAERRIVVDSRYWICGTPFVVTAIDNLKAATQSQGEF